MHDGDSLDYEHYVSDVFDTNTGIWWHCDDVNITEISDLPEGVILFLSNWPLYPPIIITAGWWISNPKA